MKHCKPLLTLGILIAGGAGFWAPQALAKDVIELKTYYPSPSGIYDTLRVAPRSASPTCSHDFTGTYYYDSDGHVPGIPDSPPGVYVCEGTKWMPMGGGDSLWKEDTTDITRITPTDSAKKIDAPSGAKIGKAEDVECGSGGKGEGLIRYNTTDRQVEYCDGSVWQPAFSKTIVGACTTVGGPANCWGFANDAGNVCLKGTKFSMDSAYAGLESPDPANFICVLGQDILNELVKPRIAYRSSGINGWSSGTPQPPGNAFRVICNVDEVLMAGGCAYQNDSNGYIIESGIDHDYIPPSGYPSPVFKCGYSVLSGLKKQYSICIKGISGGSLAP